MKKFAILLFFIAIVIGCDDGGEKKAQVKLEAAEYALSKEDFNEAKLQIDSIRILHPKAFQARKEGIKLMQQVEYKEQLKTLVYLDSMLQISRGNFEELKGKFKLEKDEEYQDIGNYFYPTQLVEKNINRSFLRAQVNERGVMYLTSIYCGGYPIHHKAIRVSAPDGTFAETPSSHDMYESKDLGVITEKVDYKLGQDGNVIGFIVLNKDKKLKVEYLGEKRYTTILTPADHKAIIDIYELTEVLSSIEEINRAKKEATTKLEFVKRKIEENKEELISER